MNSYSDMNSNFQFNAILSKKTETQILRWEEYTKINYKKDCSCSLILS